MFFDFYIARYSYLHKRRVAFGIVGCLFFSFFNVSCSNCEFDWGTCFLVFIVLVVLRDFVELVRLLVLWLKCM